MIFIAILLLSLLFLLGLSNTLLQSQIKKLVAWSQSSLPEVLSAQRVVASPSASLTIRTGDNNEETAITTSGTHKTSELKNVFATFDKNKDGFITKQELRDSMRNVGVEMLDSEAAEMVEKVDSNGDGLIDFDEFCELFDSMVGGDRTAVGLKEAFDVFDGDKDGLITVEELRLVLSSMGMKEGERLENCEEMIRKVDVDGDGMVNFDEFKEMMRSGGGGPGGRLIPVS